MLSTFNYEKDFSGTLVTILVLAVGNLPRLVRVLLEVKEKRKYFCTLNYFLESVRKKIYILK